MNGIKINRKRPANVAGQCRRIVAFAATLPEGTFYGAFAARELGIPRKAFSKHKIRLERLGMIKRIPKEWPPLYRLTNRGRRANVAGFSYSTTRGDIGEKNGAEDVYIIVPIADNSRAKLPPGFWEKVNDKLNNNIQKHTRIKIGDFTAAIRETTKNVIIQLGPVRLGNFREAFTLYNYLVMNLFQTLAHYDYWLDPSNAECRDPEFTHTSSFERMYQKGEARETFYLGYPRAPILPADRPEPTWTKYDGSPDPFTFETNDHELAELRRTFPLYLREIARLMKVYQENQNTHIPLMRNLNETIPEFREQIAKMTAILEKIGSVFYEREKNDSRDINDDERQL